MRIPRFNYLDRYRKSEWTKSTILKRAFAFVLAVAIFGYLGYRAFSGLPQILQSGLQVQPGYLALSLISHWVGVSLAVLVWSNILFRLGVLSDYIFDFQAFCVSAIARKIPGTVWYAVSRVAIYNLIHAPKGLVIIALVIEAIVIVLGGLIVLGISLSRAAFLPAWIDNQVFLIIIPALVIITWLLGPRVIRYVIQRTMNRNEDLENADIPQITTGDTFRWIIGETGVILLAAATYFFLFKSFDSTTHIPFSAVSGAFSLAVVLGPVTIWLPGDIGLKDGFFYLALNQSTTSSYAALITLIGRVWISMSEIILGVISAILLSRFIRSQNTGNETE